MPDGRDLTARAEVVHRGRTLAIASCRIENADGKLVALATGTSMYLPGRPASLVGVDQLASESRDLED
jgi:acyl-coenzyme A thioesterase PaaI-like protein